MTGSAAAPVPLAPPDRLRCLTVDRLKASGCLLIVLHHLAFYGPMADVVASAWPALIDGLARHARLAVQAFLVCSGFLVARSLSTVAALSWPLAARAIGRRYLRLAIPLLAALALTVLVSEVIRPSFAHSSLSSTPDWPQALAHLFLAQHLLDLEALSAGVWYVAVDLQLFVLALLLRWLALALASNGLGRAPEWQAGLTLVMVVLSLMFWTHEERLEDSGLFFWGAYGMGWLAGYGREHLRPPARWMLILGLGTMCLAFDERGRALTAWLAALLLLGVPFAVRATAAARSAEPLRTGVITWLSQISYAVFVVHFAVCLLVNHVVQRLWADSVPMNALGMGLALLLSLVAGHVLHQWTERPAVNWSIWSAWTGTFMASCGVAIWLSA